MSQQDVNQVTEKGALAWMAGNSVAANLIMLVLLVGGLVMGLNIKQEVFPEFSSDIVTISIAYPGASPEEVENGIIVAVEEAIEDLEGIDEITATAGEGIASVMVEGIAGGDINRLWQEIKSRVDRIQTFPDEAEDPQISIAARKREVLGLVLYGDASETVLRSLAEQIQDTLLLDEGITQVELEGIRDREILVEIPSQTLRRYGLTLKDVALALSAASVELGGGSIKTSGGDILLRLKDRKDYAKQYARLPVINLEDGSKVLLEDIATVTEGFEDTETWASFNGYRSVNIEVYRVGEQTPIQVAKAGKAAVERINATLPEGVSLVVLRDRSEIFAQRAELLMSNAYVGLALVFLFLALFLEIRLAFWVSMGIPVSILGSFVFLSFTSFSINMISMFAFIVTLGIVVDDAVVVGENIYFYRQQGLSFGRAAVEGVRRIAMPVVFSVVTNMVAFVPLMFVPGFMGKIFSTIPMVVIAVFGVSLIESLFILPAHLSHKNRRPLFFPLNHLEQWQEKFSRAFERFVKRFYGDLLLKLLHHRYAVIASGLALLLMAAGYVKSGRMGMEIFPKVESDYAFCEASLPYGTPSQVLRNVENQLVIAAEKVVRENGSEALSMGIYSQVSVNLIQVRIYLTEPDVRPLSTTQVTELWREKTGIIPGLETISFESNRGGPGGGKNLTVSLSHRDIPMLDRAGEDLAQSLSEYSMVHDIDDGSAKGKKQFDITLSDEGKRMGLTSREVASQIRNAFQGVAAVKNQRGKNEVTVRVRLPENQRTAQSTFEELVLRAPEGEILLRNAVKVIEGRAYTSIQRTNGRREIAVTANVRPASQAENVIRDMKKQILPDLLGKYPGLSYSFKGHQAEMRESISALIKGLGIAMLCVFALLAIPFKSYIQPFIIMFCIPFGMIGAVGGHLIMGYSLSIMSLFGLVAMSGVVVNDSLVLIDFANKQRLDKFDAIAAVQSAGIQRFRPILLTTLTTCGGLAPIIFETSRQARFLIPMAISLGFGILFATMITLIMVPCLYLIMEDIKSLGARILNAVLDYILPPRHTDEPD
ncbi:MAG: efflux RND transporter permease subunit [Proteobacteria bacterium]|nr:efflux RND transporter permease subunit [Pseudomonadota bacterium]MBU1387425.1 efflux RND transporter permease subunit [Pseudomonadota bacterium]MBU1541710.1 efflux RND transporter permease subunit [Pseudomonadota bacterium]MBU2481987.1 efflux RND transporter permease subunit [Pseudomonadota bacterium]